MWRRALAGFLGTIAIAIAIIAFWNANTASDNFANPGRAAVGTSLLWLLTLGAFVVGVLFLKYCATGISFRRLRSRDQDRLPKEQHPGG